MSTQLNIIQATINDLARRLRVEWVGDQQESIVIRQLAHEVAVGFGLPDADEGECELLPGYVFIDDGETGDEPVAVGTFVTDVEARTAAEGRTVLGLWTLEQFHESPQYRGDDSNS